MTPNTEKINDQIDKASEMVNSGKSKYPSMSYEDGVKAALEWITGIDEEPIDYEI